MAMDVAEILWNKISKTFEDEKFDEHSFSSIFTAIKDLMNEKNKKALCSLYYHHKLNNNFVDALCKLISSETPSEASSIDGDDKLAKLSTFADDLVALWTLINSRTPLEPSSEKLRTFVMAFRRRITSGKPLKASSTVHELSEIAKALCKYIPSDIPSEASSTVDELAEPTKLAEDLWNIIVSEAPLEASSAVEKSSKFAMVLCSLYDLDDVLEESQKFERKCKKLQKKLLLVNPVSKLYSYARNKKRLKSIEDNLRCLSSHKETKSLHFPTERYTYPSINTKVTGFDEPLSKVIGFDEHLKRIEGKLLNCRFKTFGIFGMAGAGKTTLARMVFNSEGIIFDKRIWLCLSDSSTEKKEDLNMKIVKCILEELDYDSDSLAIDISLNDLLGELYKRLEKKRYLIVLDDVWPNLIKSTAGDVSLSTKHCLSKGMPKGGDGVVIVTSRSQEVVKHMVGEVEDNLLDFSSSLDNERCWELFRHDMPGRSKNKLLSHVSSEFQEEIKYQCSHLPLAAKALARIFHENDKDFMKEKDSILKDFYIGDDLFGQGSESPIEIPKYPVLVFLNTETGGNHMKKLFAIICRHLNKKQVFDLSDPKKELLGFWASANSEVKKKLKVFVVGGDAAANSIRAVLTDMKLMHPTSIASVPYKVENNISKLSEQEELEARESVKLFMKQIQDAEYMRTDRWHISIKIKDSMDSVAHEDISRALHMFHLHQEVNDEKQIKDKYAALQGEFSKCFMIGLGTSVCSGVGCFSSSTRTISKLGTVKIKKRDKHLTDHSMSSSVRSIYCHNLYRIPGGLNPQEKPTDKEKQEVNNLSGVQRPSVTDDKLLKITTSKEGLPPESRHGILDEIDQVEEIRFLLGTAEHLNISIDGALWERIPVNGIESINISRCGQINFLAMPDCEVKSKPVPDSTAIVDHGHKKGDPRSSEIRRKLSQSARTKSNLNI